MPEIIDSPETINITAAEDVVISTGGVERARIHADGTGAGLFSGSLTYVVPSGDTTGVSDTAAIAAAFLNTDVVVLRGGLSRSSFYVTKNVDCCIELGDGKTIVFWDAHVVRADGSNCPILGNADTVGGNSDISVHCVGYAYLDGNVLNQTKQNTWQDFGVFFSHVSGLTVTGRLRAGPFHNECVRLSACDGPEVDVIDCRQDGSVVNQGGVGFGNGTQKAHVKVVRGNVGDDAVLFANFTTKNALLYSRGSHLDDTSDNTVDVVDVAPINGAVNYSGNGLRILAGDGQKVRNNHIGWMRLRNGGGTPDSAVRTGLESYVTTPPTNLLCYGNTIGGLVVECDLVLGVICADAAISGPSITSVDLNAGAVIPFLVGNSVAPTNVVSGINIGRVTVFSQDTLTDVSHFIGGSPSWDIDQFICYGHVGRVLHNGVATACRIRNWRIVSLDTSLIGSSAKDTGEFGPGEVGTFNGSKYISAATAVRFKAGSPVLTSVDTTPDATERSVIDCDSSKVLDGGATSAARYIAIGGSWVRMAG